MDANVQDEGDSSMSAAEGQSEAAQSVLDLRNVARDSAGIPSPPYLTPLFELIAINGNTFRFKCLLYHQRRACSA